MPRRQCRPQPSAGRLFRRTRDPAAFQHRTATLLPPPRALNSSPRRSCGTSGERPRLDRHCPRSAQAQTPLHPLRSSPAFRQAGAGGGFTWSARRPPHSRGERGRSRRLQPRMLRAAPLALRRRAGWGKFGAAERASGTAALPSAPPGRSGRRPGLAHSPTKDEERKQQTISRGTALLPGLLSPPGSAASPPRHFRGSGTEPSVSRGGARHRPAPPPAPCAAAPAPHRSSPLLTVAARAAVSDNFPPSAGRAPTATSGLAPSPPRRVRGRAQRRAPGPRLMRGSSPCAEGGGTAGQRNSKGIVLALEKKNNNSPVN